MQIGAIPAVMTVGWFLPPLFTAAHAERLPRKLPFIMRWTGWERVPFLILALVAFFLADRAPALSMALLLGDAARDHDRQRIADAGVDGSRGADSLTLRRYRDIVIPQWHDT